MSTTAVSFDSAAVFGGTVGGYPIGEGSSVRRRGGRGLGEGDPVGYAGSPIALMPPRRIKGGFLGCEGLQVVGRV